MYLFLVDDDSEHKKAKGVNKNVVTRYVIMNTKMFVNMKCLRHSVNRIQSKNHRIGTYEIN